MVFLKVFEVTRNQSNVFFSLGNFLCVPFFRSVEKLVSFKSSILKRLEENMEQVEPTI